MTETPTADAEDAAAARAAEQARLRKQRREAKIKAGGASRLNKITGLGGGIPRDVEPQGPPSQTPPTAGGADSQPIPEAQHADPEEVDISQHYYAPHTTQRPPAAAEPSLSEAQLRQMMLGFDTPSSGSDTPAGGNPFLLPGSQGQDQGIPNMIPPGMEDDPMMKLFQQMMGGAGAGGMPGTNPFASPEMQQQQAQQAQQAVTDKSANIWRILHAVFALGLGLYVALSTTFTGTKMEREYSSLLSKQGADDGSTYTDTIEQTRAYFFYLFVTVEALLLTTRLVLEKNRGPPTGILWSITGLLPPHVQSGMRHVMRYSQIFSTIRSDALVCVFVLGVCSWLRS